MKKTVCIAMALCLLFCVVCNAQSATDINVFTFLEGYEIIMEYWWGLRTSSCNPYFTYSNGQYAMYNSSDIIIQFDVSKGSSLEVMSISVCSGEYIEQRLMSAMMSYASLRNAGEFYGMSNDDMINLFREFLEGAEKSSEGKPYKFYGAEVTKHINDKGEISYYIK